MKKYLVGTLLASMLVVVPFVSSAATIAELQAMIVQLQAQIASLMTPSSVPVINSVNLSVTPGWLEIWGTNLDKAKTVYVGTKFSNIASVHRSDKLSIYYGDIPSGYYPVYIISATGEKSNTVMIGVPSGTSTKVISPNGGEILSIKKNYNITWKSNNPNKISLEVFNVLGGAGGWGAPIADNLDPSVGTYSWTPDGPFPFFGDGFKINIWDQKTGALLDSSDETFSFGVATTSTWSAKIDLIDHSASSRRILVPGGWVKLRGMRLTDKVTIVGTNYPPLQVRVSDNDRRVDFKLDPRMTTGSYEAYVTGANGKASNRVVLNLTGEAVVDLVEPAPGATVAPGAWVKLRGQRLTTNVNWFHPSVCAAACPIPPGECESTCYPGTKANQYPVLGAKLSDNNTRLDFKVDPRELPGQYEIEVINSWGQSNRFPFTVVGSSTTPVPAEVAPRINSISGNQYPGGWIKLSGMRLTTDVRITKADGTGTTVYVPLDIRDTNGNGTRIDFKLDPAMPVGAYYINVYSATNMKSPTLRFPVSVRPAVSSSVSQIANILSSLSAVLGQMKDE